MAFEAKNVSTRENQLAVQEVCVSLADNQLAVVSGGNLAVIIGEPVASVRCATKVLAAGGNVTAPAAASASIVDSVTLLAGGNASAILYTGLVLAANDQLIVRYQTVE